MLDVWVSFLRHSLRHFSEGNLVDYILPQNPQKVWILVHAGIVFLNTLTHRSFGCGYMNILQKTTEEVSGTGITRE